MNKIHLCIYSKLIFRSIISRDHLHSKLVYLSYSKMRSSKTVKKFYDVSRSH